MGKARSACSEGHGVSYVRHCPPVHTKKRSKRFAWVEERYSRDEVADSGSMPILAEIHA